MNTFLIILAVVISTILLGMIVYGIYWIILNFQVWAISRSIVKLWQLSSVLVVFLSREKQEKLRIRLKDVLGIELQIKYFNDDVTENDNEKVEEILENISKLIKKCTKRVDKSFYKTKELTNDATEQVADAINLIMQVIEE